ncbi:MAG TPA: hypothetical protein VGK23_01245 [Methanomassiliicoccales archaeon]
MAYLIGLAFGRKDNGKTCFGMPSIIAGMLSEVVWKGRSQPTTSKANSW